MRTRLIVALALGLTAAVLVAGTGSGASARVPEGFFGIVPQTELTPEDVRYMKAGGIERVRVPVTWGEIQPTRRGGYDWSIPDKAVEAAAQGGLRVLPFLSGTPRWLSKPTTLPVGGRLRTGWVAFVKAAVERYGPGGDFWSEHAQVGVNYEPAITRPLPVRSWQIWNEANFFYFAYPVSPAKYAKLVTITSKAIKQVQPGARIVLSGLFAEPTAAGKRGMPASTFLDRVYSRPGIKSHFDGIALHPYAVDAETLEEMVEEIHGVTKENRDRPGLYITEMGWGSQNNFKQVAFEQGIRGQARQLKDSYGFLIDNQRRLNVKEVYWFSWKDATGYCNFCDSVGFFRASARFHPKPAWRAFVGLTGGRVRP